MSKRSKKENELLNYLSEDERKVYEEFEAKLKAKRDVAVKRQMNIPVSESILSGDQETDWQLYTIQENSPM